MRKFFSENRRRKVLAGLACLVVAAAAYAYWTLNATGTGSGSVGNGNGSIVLSGSVNGALSPGASKSVDLSAQNTGDSSTQLGTISGTVSTDKAACEAGDFHLADKAVNQVIPAGGTVNTSTSISMDDTNQNQDACKGAALTLNLSGTSN